MLDGSLAHPRPAALATVVGVVNGLTMVLSAWAIGWTTDHLVIPALAGREVSRATWWVAVGAILGVSTVRWTTIVLRGIASGRVQHAAQARTRRAVVRHYLDLDLGWHRRHSPGRLLSTAVSDVDAVWLPTAFLYFALGMVVMLVVAMVQLMTRDAALGAVGLTLVTSVLALNLLYQRALTPRAQAAQAARGDLGAAALESIDGGQVVRTLGLVDHEERRIGDAAGRLRAANVRMGDVSSLFDPMLELLPTGAILAVLAVGAGRVESGALTVGVVVEVVYLLLTVSIPLNVISRFLGMLPMSAAGGSRVAAVLESDNVTRFGARRLADEGPLDVRVVHAQVTRGSRVLLDDIDLHLAPGEIVALVGATGAGKSTVVDLVTRQIDPTSGVVRIGTPTTDGVDAVELAADQVASHIGLVAQDSWLFAGSLLDNLVLDGHPREARSYRDDEVEAALVAARADEVVRALPDGLDTIVGERGGRLSGGQRQRICLARTLLRGPRLLVLDDATSALDPAVERDVLDAIADLRGRTTVLVVGGRPSSVAIADRVVLLDRGRIVSSGTHAELMAAEPAYGRVLDAYGSAQHRV
ncbi:ABC transporter ATP-binding protein [Aeromicrobium endophyticum]|uniref:ABC transporter ATP-binding protein n=2 Tax=Aeromicrobium endophyticum TaxID=2292704 RepID=A0A371PCV2_9ACTN|nr:ABC transporter ATP-binding protein [Aeromicrobium endophyticum]